MATDDKKQKKGRNHKYGSLKQALEPRLLFDASLVAPPSDAAATADANVQDTAKDTTPHPQDIPAAKDTSAPASSSTPPVEAAAVDTQDVSKTATDIRTGNTSSRVDAQELAVSTVHGKELVFIDYRVANSQELLSGISENAEVHFLNAGEDGVQQISDILKSHSGDVSGIHILSHGESGSIQLGDSTLDTKTLNERYANEIADWHSSLLSADAGILLYGCDVAKGSLGEQFVTELSIDAGIHVAASVDYTGSEALAGNWVLEFQTGSIGSSISDVFNQDALNHYDYLMAQPVVDLNGPTVLNLTDNFSTGTYTGGSSNLSTTWLGGWFEFDGSPTRAFSPGGSTNSDNSPTGGNIVMPSVATGGTVSGLGTGAEIAMLGHSQQYGDYIERAVNLQAYTSATISFSYRTAGLTSADAIAVKVSKDGGGTFVTLEK